MINRFNMDQQTNTPESDKTNPDKSTVNSNAYNSLPLVLQTTLNNIIHGLAQKEEDYTASQFKENFVRNLGNLTQDQLNYFVGNMMTLIAISDSAPQDEKLDVDKNFISFLIKLFY